MNKEKIDRTEERDERAREERTKRKAKTLRSSLRDHEFFGGGRLWFMLFHSKLLIANDMYWVVL